MRQILRNCLQGKLLNRAEALNLVGAQGDERQALLATAAQLRDGYKGRIVTFSPKVFVPLTNLCRDFCGYCTFRKAPDEAGAKTLTLEEVLRVVRQGKLLGCTEVLFSLGDKPEAIYPEMKSFLNERGHQRTLDYLYEACRVVLEETGLLPHSNPGVMGQGDLQRLRDVNPSMGLMLESVSERLLLAAEDAVGEIVGTVQVVLNQPENQPHRGDIAKLLVHRRVRRQGLGAALIAAAERSALKAGKTLLVLDTVTGGDAERLYARQGWQRCGQIPNYALWPNGTPCATTIFFKFLHN